MNRTLVAIVLVPLLAACGAAGASSGADSSPEKSLPGAAQRCVGHIDNEKREPAYEGKSEAAAREAAQANGLSVRLVGRGDECFVLTQDLRPDRLNLYVDERGNVRWAARF